jgi:hypothetical protein
MFVSWDHSPASPPRHHVVELLCPPGGTSSLANAIRARGNIPLSIAGTTLLELPMRDIAESWRSTTRLPAQKVAALSWHLAHELVEGDEPESHPNEAAALFLLALRHHHASLDRALAGCRILWNDNATAEKVEYLT